MQWRLKQVDEINDLSQPAMEAWHAPWPVPWRTQGLMTRTEAYSAWQRSFLRPVAMNSWRRGATLRHAASMPCGSGLRISWWAVSPFLAAQIIRNDCNAGCQQRQQALARPRRGHFSIDRPIQHERREEAIVSQPGQEGERISVGMRDMGCRSLDRRSPAAGSVHVGFDPVSTMKINRLRSGRCRCVRQRARHRATLGRNCSAAIRAVA